MIVLIRPRPAPQARPSDPADPNSLLVYEPFRPHGDPEGVAAGITLQNLPREGDQFVTRDMRAFAVDLVEWRYDLGEVHLFCTEYPKQAPPGAP